MLKEKRLSFPVIGCDASRKGNNFAVWEPSLSLGRSCCNATKRWMSVVFVNRLRLAACHPCHNGVTVLKLTLVQYPSSSALRGSRGTKKEANLLYYWRSCGNGAKLSCVHEEASLHWLSGCATIVSGLRLSANCPVETLFCVANLTEGCYRSFKVLHLKHTANE